MRPPTHPGPFPVKPTASPPRLGHGLGTILGLSFWFVASALPADPLRFARVDESWGLDFRHHSGASGHYYMVETNGGGVVIFDYDDDGDPDLFLADGAPLPGYEGPTPRSRLFRNEGPQASGPQFIDVTAEAGLEFDTYASGGAAADVDGDGDLDLYITAFGANLLFRNLGDGTFQQIGTDAGVGDPSWSASAAFADADRDGDLDLYVANYVDFTLENNIPCGDSKRNLRGYCGPDVYHPAADRFYRNRGDGTFEEATDEVGLGKARGAGLAVAWHDLDQDGWPDLYVANDLTPNFLFHNRGDGTFEDRSLLSGTAYGPRGTAEAGMGVAPGDFDGDGRIDLVVTNYEGETNTLYGQRGPLLFTDLRFASGLAEPTLLSLAFGVGAGDFDHDRDLDLVFANGHVRENAELFSSRSRYRQPNQVFENQGTGRFREVDEAGLDHAAASRGLALADLDRDGDLDVVISNVDDRLEVYENLGSGGHWLQVAFRTLESNQDVVGHRIEGIVGSEVLLREVHAGSSYMSQHERTLHLGVGEATTLDLRFLEPGAPPKTLRGVPTDRRLVWMH